jgi:hypothetical protein
MPIKYSAREEAVRRRAFIALLSGAVAGLNSTHCSAQSQPSRAYKLGVLAAVRHPPAIEALQDGLRGLGYIEGQNLKTDTGFVRTEPRQTSLLLSWCASIPTLL